MANVGSVISSIRNIMRQDRGISGDAQRLEQLGWMLFLKIMDDKDQELEVIKDKYVSVNDVPKKDAPMKVVSKRQKSEKKV